METLIHADIFFLVSTVALVFVTIGIVTALIYLIKILRTVSKVSEKVKEESDSILDDVRELRGNIKKTGFKMAYVRHFFSSMFGGKKKSKNKTE